MSEGYQHPNDLESISNFLVTEHSEIFQEFRRLRDEGIRRLTFYVTISTAVLGGIVFSFQIAELPVLVLKIISLFSILMLVLLGWDTFRYLIVRDISSDFNMRSMARIRRFFVDLEPKVKNYLVWSTHDDPSHYLDKGDGKYFSTIMTTMAYFISMLVGFGLSFSVSLLVDSLVPLFSIGFVGFLISNYGLRKFAMKMISEAREQAESDVKFPRIQPVPHKGK